MIAFELVIISIFLLYLLLTGIVSAVQAHRDRELISYLNEHGSTTLGQIVSHRVPGTGTRRVRTFFVTYRYEIDGQVYTHEQIVRKDHFNTLRDGESVSVRYLPLVPTTAMLTGKDRDDAQAQRHRTNALLGFGFASLFLLFILLLLVVVLGRHLP